VKSELWATVDVRHDAVPRDVSISGALLEVTLSSDQLPIRAASLRLPDGGPELTVQVRRLTLVVDAPVADRYLVGVAFVQLSSADRQAVAAFIAARKQRDARSS